MSNEAEMLAVEDFWSQKHVQELVKDGLGLCRESARQIVKHAKVLNLPREFIPEIRGVERMRGKGENSTKRMHSTERMCGLLFCTFDLLHRMPERDVPQENCFNALRNAVRQLCTRAPANFIGRKLFSELLHDDINPNLRVVIKTIGSQFAIADDEFIKISTYFFPEFDIANLPAAPRKAYFNTYRFHAAPGQIVKTFTVIESATREIPACLFYNFFVEDDPRFPRQATGIVIPTVKAIYFIGGLLSGTGMKFMAMPRLVQTTGPHEHLRGLMVTFDNNEVIVGARFVMQRTEKTTHSEAGAGIYELHKLPEVRPFLREIRNRIRFDLEDEVFLADESTGDRPIQIDENRIVEETRRALEVRGVARLRYADGRPFNPATEDDYTYNSALTVWNERD